MAEQRDRERIATLEATVNMSMPRIEKCFADLSLSIKEAKTDIMQFIEKSRADFLDRHKAEIKGQEDRLNTQDNRNTEYWSAINKRLDSIDKRHALHAKFIGLFGLVIVFFFGWAAVHPESADAVAGVARSVFVKPN